MEQNGIQKGGGCCTRVVEGVEIGGGNMEGGIQEADNVGGIWGGCGAPWWGKGEVHGGVLADGTVGVAGDRAKAGGGGRERRVVEKTWDRRVGQGGGCGGREAEAWVVEKEYWGRVKRGAGGREPQGEVGGVGVMAREEKGREEGGRKEGNSRVSSWRKREEGWRGT